MGSVCGVLMWDPQVGSLCEILMWAFMCDLGLRGGGGDGNGLADRCRGGGGDGNGWESRGRE